jgi:carbon-monoxide dehydrogenase medium subunit
MNFRLAQPAHLFDLNGVVQLDFLRVEAGVLRIGALARHAAFHRPPCDGATGTLLAEVAGHIAHYPIRQRGTLAGSIAHADPAAEWCLVAVTLGAQIVAVSRAGERLIDAADFFLGALATQLGESELIAEVRLPVLGAGWRTGFYEFSRRAGDFAIAMTAAALRLERGVIREALIGIGGVEERPARSRAAEEALLGSTGAATDLADAADIAARTVNPMEDLQADAPYRRDLVRATTRRALEQAMTGRAS